MKPSGNDRSVKNGYSKISGPSLDMVFFEASLVEARNGVVVNGVGWELTEETETKCVSNTRSNMRAGLTTKVLLCYTNDRLQKKADFV